MFLNIIKYRFYINKFLPDLSFVIIDYTCCKIETGGFAPCFMDIDTSGLGASPPTLKFVCCPGRTCQHCDIYSVIDALGGKRYAFNLQK